ncbi:hypothetical protein PoB_006757600 [Plakobranchus ocellatus]|uniref:Uncharacterized protein n=1 Tax=Plakobranchus ocellatus TaxID=259542 RepID=A0AAV4DAX5_9GAST|nr:hypothetical protein PoB_006757600 [Plakobranchus ocellatus]
MGVEGEEEKNEEKEEEEEEDERRWRRKKRLRRVRGCGGKEGNEKEENEEDEYKKHKKKKINEESLGYNIVAINANEDIQIAIDSMTGNFQERFETFVSALKSSVSSSSRAQAEKIFLSAVPALSYKFPDPTGLAGDTDEENSGQSEVDSLKAEFMNLKKQQEKLERRVISEKQEVQNNFSSIEKKMKKNNLRLRENIAQLESNNKAHVDEVRVSFEIKKNYKTTQSLTVSLCDQ